MKKRYIKCQSQDHWMILKVSKFHKLSSGMQIGGPLLKTLLVCCNWYVKSIKRLCYIDLANQFYACNQNVSVGFVKEYIKISHWLKLCTNVSLL